ncbi:putative Ig domain-containing protein [Spirosoma arcticum]
MHLYSTNSTNQHWYWSAFITLTAFVTFVTQLSAQSLPPGFVNSQLQGGYNTPVGLVFSADGQQFFVWDKSGRVWVSTWNGTTYTKQATPVVDIHEEVGNWGDGGFLSVCLDPDFSRTGLLYLFYVVDRHHLLYYGTPQYNRDADEYNSATISRVTRYQVTNAGGVLTADGNSRRVLLGETKTTGIPMLYPSHVGGTLLFGRDGTLLVSTGDNAFYDGADVGSNGNTYYEMALREGIMRPAENVGALRAQMVGSLCGKVLRINPTTGDGVSGNPFFDAANPRAAGSRVYTLGLRNPYRMTLQPGTGSTIPSEGNPGTILMGDVGWSTAEDFHYIDQAGLNCGWPLYEGMDRASQYYGQNRRNEDEPGRPTFESLCQQPTSPANDADPARRRFTHSRPALDWQHNAPVARVPAFDGSTPVARTIGTPGAPAGVPFSGKASIGGAYYVGTGFPAAYQNSYFFADFDQNWIRNLVLHDHGDHVVHEVREFAPSGTGQGIVDLEVNPRDGSLVYVNVSGQIMRISYGGNQPPVARPSANPTFGFSPLNVSFSGSSSTDPEGHSLRFHWDFGDGTTSEEANPEHTFVSTDERQFTVTLTVTDGGQLTDTKQLTISLNSVAPTVRITSPADNTLYPLDRTSYYNPTAEVTGSNLTYEWQVSLLHNTHEHPEAIITEISPQIRIAPVGCSGTDSYAYRVSLKVTNRSGLSATTAIHLYPDCQSDNGAVSQVTTVPGPNTVRVNWQNPAISFDEVLVAARASSGFQAHPTGTNYVADANFTGNGTPFGGGKVVYRGQGGEVTVSNLSASVPYYFRLYTRVGETWNEGVEVMAIPDGAAAFVITGVTLVRCEPVSAGQRQLTFAPQYSGLNGQAINFSVVNELSPTTNPGPYTLNLYTDNPTIRLGAEQGGSAGQASFTYNWLSACTGTPPPPPTNQPPTTAQPIANQQAVVGQPFRLVVPANTFTDPNGDALTLSMSGLPSGLSFDANAATLSGTPTATGQTTVTLRATDPGNLWVSTSFLITVNSTVTPPDPNPTNFAITGVTLVRCEPVSANQRQLTFAPQYSGLNGQAINFSVVNEMGSTTSPGPYTLNLYTDNPTIRLGAEQGGSAGPASFAYNWLSACTGTPPPPPTNQPPITAQPVANQQAVVGQSFRLVVPANTFTDPNGDVLTLLMSGLPGGLSFDANAATISGSPTAAGQTTVTLTAIDPGNLATSTSFLITVNSTITPPDPNPTGFAITGVTLVRCESVSEGQRQLTFAPQYAGLNGQAISFWVANEMGSTTNPGPYTLNLYTDNPTIRLWAEQVGSPNGASFAYNWLAACAGTAARRSAESIKPLTVRVLGNPVLTGTLEVEIGGGTGQWLKLQIFDGRGLRTGETVIRQPSSVERTRVPLSGPAGLYLLQVSTPTQQHTVKVVKP